MKRPAKTTKTARGKGMISAESVGPAVGAEVVLSDTPTVGGLLDIDTVQGNQDFRATIADLRQSRDRLSRINALIRSQLSVGKSARVVECCGRMVGPFVPDRVRKYLPASIIPFCSEEVDVLALIEQMQRMNITNVQDSLNAIATIARMKREELDQLAEDIKRARSEGWDAEALQRYMAARANITLYDEVSRLLSNEFRTLPPREKERRKKHLLQRLDSNVEISKTLMNALVEVCLSGLQIFHQAVAQYHDYVHAYRPIQTIRDAAKALTNTNETMFAAGDALVATFGESVRAIELAMKAARLTDQYAVASKRTQAALERGRCDLERKLLALRETQALNVPVKGVVSGEAIGLISSSS